MIITDGRGAAAPEDEKVVLDQEPQGGEDFVCAQVKGRGLIGGLTPNDNLTRRWAYCSTGSREHQSGVREPPAGQIIIRGQTTNKSATLYLCAHKVFTALRFLVKNHLLILRCGRSAAISDYHA